MAVWRDLFGTLNTFFRVAKNGFRVRAVGNVCEIRTPDDSAYAEARCAQGTQGASCVTRSHLEANFGFFENGAVSDVGGNSIKDATYGHLAPFEFFTVPKPGVVFAVAVHVSNARTAGTCKAYATINTVAQNAPGEYAEINAANTSSAYINLATPVPFVAGDVLGTQTETTGFTPTGSDALISLYYRFTE